MDPSQAVLMALRELAEEQGGAITLHSGSPVQFVYLGDQQAQVKLCTLASKHLPASDPITTGLLIGNGRNALVDLGFLVMDEGGAQVDLRRTLPEVS